MISSPSSDASQRDYWIVPNVFPPSDSITMSLSPLSEHWAFLNFFVPHSAPPPSIFRPSLILSQPAVEHLPDLDATPNTDPKPFQNLSTQFLNPLHHHHPAKPNRHSPLDPRSRRSCGPEDMDAETTTGSQHTSRHSTVTPHRIPRPVSICWQCTSCGRIVIESHTAGRAAPPPTPPAAQCLIRTGEARTHPVLGRRPQYIEGGICRYERMDAGARLSIRPALLSRDPR